MRENLTPTLSEGEGDWKIVAKINLNKSEKSES
jgi:hypothetical protein